LKSLTPFSICKIPVGKISNAFLLYLKFISQGNAQVKGLLVLLSVTLTRTVEDFQRVIFHPTPEICIFTS